MNSQIPELINYLDFKGIKFTIKDGMISINLNEEKKDLPVKIDEKQTQNEKMDNSVDTIGEQVGNFQVPDDAPKFGFKTPTPHKREKFHLVSQSFDVIVLAYRRVITAFKNKGINFPVERQNELEKMIRKYNVIQDELIKTLCYLEEFACAIDVSAQSKPQTMEQSEERLNKINEKQNSIEQSLLDNLMRLAEEDDSEYKPI